MLNMYAIAFIDYFDNDLKIELFQTELDIVQCLQRFLETKGFHLTGETLDDIYSQVFDVDHNVCIINLQEVSVTSITWDSNAAKWEFKGVKE